MYNGYWLKYSFEIELNIPAYVTISEMGLKITTTNITRMKTLRVIEQKQYHFQCLFKIIRGLKVMQTYVNITLQRVIKLIVGYGNKAL